MVLRNDFNGKMILQHRNVRMPSHGFHQPALDFESRVVSMMQDTEFRMAALTMQIEVTLFILVEVHPPLHHILNAFRRPAHHLLYGLPVTDVVTGNDGVLNMFVKIVNRQISDRGYSALGLGRIGLVHGGFAYKGHTSLAGYLKRVAHAGYARADYQKVKFTYHLLNTFNYLQS